MWQFILHADNWGLVALAVLLFAWLLWLTRQRPPDRPRKEDRWPFGEDPNKRPHD